MPIFFIRHGESEANERNQFAGQLDTPLTNLGIEQAKQAGHVIACQRLKFDEIHVSPLTRARLTAQKIIETSSNTSATLHIANALLERDFGFLQGRNKSLWKKVFGYKRYDAMLHSSDGMPPGGESWEEMYHRVRKYYEQVLLPASQRGTTILVVTHKYIVEMFALVIAGLPPQSYCDFKIPNSRPLSEYDLFLRAKHVPRSVNTLGEIVEIHLPAWLLLAAVLGIVLKLLIRWSLPDPLFEAGSMICLASSTFFGLLWADPSRLTGITNSLKNIQGILLIRLVLGIGLILFSANTLLQLLGSFFLLPPATIVPTFSLLWGKDHTTALRITLALSLLSPLVLTATIFVSMLLETYLYGPHAHLFMLIGNSFWLMVLIAVIFPALVAQGYRFSQPIKAGTLSTNWSWIGGLMSLPLALLSTYYFTPKYFAGLLMPPGSGLSGSSLLLVISAFGGLFFIAKFVKVQGWEDEIGHALRLTTTMPNIFLWFAIISVQAVSASSSLLAAIATWTALIFFAAPFIEEQFLLHHIRKEILLPGRTKMKESPISHLPASSTELRHGHIAANTSLAMQRTIHTINSTQGDSLVPQNTYNV